jgi:Flp pilus assembly protein TadD
MRLVIPYCLCLLATAALFLSDSVHADQDDPRLPALFKELRETGDEDKGDRIGRQIARIWGESGNDGIDEVVRQGKQFMDQGKLQLALDNFTAVTRLEPEFAEGWNKRAAVLYRMGEFDAAAKSVRQALALEPRHFLALAGLGVIHMRMGKLKEALQAFDVALQINPHLSVTREIAEQIRKHLEKH